MPRLMVFFFVMHRRGSVRVCRKVVKLGCSFVGIVSHGVWESPARSEASRALLAPLFPSGHSVTNANLETNAQTANRSALPRRLVTSAPAKNPSAP